MTVFCRSLFVLSLLLAALFFLAGVARTSAQEETKPSEPAQSRYPVCEASGKLLKALETRGDWQWNEVPLREVAERLEKELGIPLDIDERALEEVGLDPTVPVPAINLQGISAGSMLRLILRDLDLTWMVQNEMLRITTPEAAEEHLHICVYRVADLTQDSDADSLATVVMTIVEPDSWEVVGGPGALSVVGDTIVVSNVSEVHEDVGRLLDRLRELNKEQKDHPEKPQQTVLYLEPSYGPNVKALEERVSLAASDVPLSEAIDRIAGQLDVAVLIERRALEEVGLDADELEVHVAASDVPARLVLQRMLSELDLTWQYRDGLIMVTTPEAADETLTTAIFPVYDLIPKADPGTSDATLKSIENIATAIQTTVDSESWDVLGGPGAIAKFSQPAALVVSQTRENLLEIAGLLRAMRQVGVNLGEPQEEGQFVLRIYRVDKPELAGFANAAQLLPVIVRLVQPESWRRQEAVIESLGPALVVRQTPAVHREIAELLERLGEPSVKGLGAGGGFF